MIASLLQRIERLERKQAQMLRAGVVDSLDVDAARVRVRVADSLLTPPLPWLAWAGAARVWRAPAVGEAVLVLSPSGDLAQGYALCGVFNAQHPPPDQAAETVTVILGAGDAEDRLHYAEGEVQLHLRGALQIHSEGAVQITAAGDAEVRGEQVVVHASTKATVQAQQVEIAGSAGQVVTTAHTCAFTGAMHPVGSSKVKAAL